MIHAYRDCRAVLKFTTFLLTAMTFMLVQVIFVSWIPVKNIRTIITLKNVRIAARIGSWILGLNVSKLGYSSIENGELQVSNHLSYLDILAISSVEPALFVTSREIREVFFLGTLTSLGGCFFVERRKHLRTPQILQSEISEITEKLGQRFNVFLFPEGTSGDGSSVLPFKAHFFQLAIDAGIKIKPATISYRGPNKDLAPWYGKMPFPDHLYSVCREKSFQVEFQLLPPIDGKDYSCKFSLAGDVQKMIKDAYERN